MRCSNIASSPVVWIIVPLPRIGTTEPFVAARNRRWRPLWSCMVEKVARIFWNFLIFENSIADSIFLRNAKNSHFWLKSDKKHNNNWFSEKQSNENEIKNEASYGDDHAR